MIDKLYIDLRDHIIALQDSEGIQVIQHVDLWNRQVDFLETETPFNLPAVFIQFHQSPCKQDSEGIQTVTQRITLHLCCKSIAGSYSGSAYESDSLRRLAILPMLFRHMTIFTTPVGANYTTGRFVREGFDIDHDHDDVTDDRLMLIVPFYDYSGYYLEDWVTKRITPEGFGTIKKLQ